MNEIDFININQFLNLESEFGLEHEFGNGYIKLMDRSFNEYTGYYKVGSEILDGRHNTIGNLTIDGYLYDSHVDSHKVNFQYYMRINLEGDIKKVLSLSL